jgi:hypothetical protein
VTRALLVLVTACLLAVAGCGGDDEAAPTDTGTTTTPAETTRLAVYFLRDGKVWPALREVPETDTPATSALEELFLGPTTVERRDLGFSTAIPGGIALDRLEIEDGVATLEVDDELTDESLAQTVYTLTQFPTVDAVETQGGTYTRADVEHLTPAILVESPLSFEEVPSPLRVTGTANTFEATFQYELTDTDGRIVDENFVTATSGTGERGTFDFTTKPYTIPFDGIGSLIVYELSAEDGKTRLHLVEIPLKMSK